MAPTKVDPWVRLFDVSEPTLHRKGYTIYKITSTVFPRNCPEAATQVIVWRRFSEFKKLYKGLHALHTSLHLKGTFPPFPKDKVFGRFEPDVIEERRLSALLLLEFVAQFPPLFTCQLFVKFFEGCKKSVLVNDHACHVEGEPVLQPEVLYELQTSPPPQCLGDRESLKTTTKRITGDQLGGVWRYCQTMDDVSPGSTTDESDGASPEELVTASRNLISATDIALFDPLVSATSSSATSPDAKSAATATTVSTFENSWLLSALVNCQSPTASVSRESDSHAADFDFPPAFADLDEECGANVSISVHHVEMPGDEPVCASEKRLPSDVSLSSRPPAPIRFEEMWMLADDSDGGEPPGDYLMTAARLLTSAQECEAEGDAEGAFTLYKSVVGTLLSGVQEDLDPIRRDAVRRRTAHYLQRAEEIYKKHLAGREPDRVRWAVTGQRKDHLECESEIKLLKSPPSELGRYKVLGVVGKVMLALDSMTDTPVVIKVLAKSAVKSTGVFMSPWVVPSNVPCMVRLLRFHETNESIFLVLQHAVGGKLWNYIGSYLQGCGSAFPSADHPVEGDGGFEFDNIYTGRKLMEAAVRVSDCLREGALKTDPVDDEPAYGDSSSSSYVRLFTDLTTAFQRGRAPLAECRYVATQLGTSPGRMPIATDAESKNSAELWSGGGGDYMVFDYESQRNDSDKEEENISWSDLLENVDPDELIAKAQKLMQHVDETLRESNTTSNIPNSLIENTEEDHQDKANVFTHASIGRPTDSLKRVTPPGRPIDVSRRRRLTSDDAFPNSTAPRRSSAGSLELKGFRGRHFSSVFHRLDESRNATIAAGLPESCIRVWAAELVVAISSLHEKGIMCRDLKPDNVLLGERGHIVLSYFSQWPSVERVVDPLTKECLYAAPEIGGIFPVTPSCDWWSLGALIFELLTGKTLLSSHAGSFTTHTQLNIPCQLSAEAQDLLRGLLCFNANERLELESVKAHSFFAGVDWKDIA